MKTVYITKHALSLGIKTIQGDVWSNGMIRDRSSQWGVYYHGKGNQWHETMEGAKAKAEDMRKKKIASLEKQIAKLKALEF